MHQALAVHFPVMLAKMEVILLEYKGVHTGWLPESSEPFRGKAPSTDFLT